ncbi:MULTISPECIES: hypothetical protein [unclassified Methylobacterium]|uniref:hypothetical protein n=1 Tax=unclassified Methylobacterium TaxID=2615210 RepID=UPI00226A350B|nr:MULTISPECIES: hypothetical protein [unclassified Methylobacterium]
MTRTQTHTVAELELPGAAYDEIRKLLKSAGYQHAFGEDGLIDMTGIGVTRCDAGEPFNGDFVHSHWTDLFDGPEAYLAWRDGQRAGPSEPTDSFGAHLTEGVIGRIGDREIGPGHVVLSEERYRWLLLKAGLSAEQQPEVTA